MRCVDNSRKHFNYEYGNGKNCSKTVLAQLFKTCIQILGGAQFSKHILSNVVGGDAAVQDILSFAWFG